MVRIVSETIDRKWQRWDTTKHQQIQSHRRQRSQSTTPHTVWEV